ncbi:zincin [Decorospora gaudefroyi]|uniref:Zincin n=1 Tax=Decorospora gaudefroyi TaxID=184978 RepID=A0A6A5KPN1_9PLEO|nr:zincin [Decorospora gaudefroyi]
MFFLWLLLAVLTAAVAVQEPVPHFGPFCGTRAAVYDNGTRATNWAEYIAEYELKSGLSGQGAVDAWEAEGGPIPWPRMGAHGVVIPYCFTQAKDRRNVRNVVENAMAKWIQYLGGPAGRESGHAIRFKERKDAHEKPMYCAPTNYRDGWNACLDKDTVAIEYTEGKGWGGSVGLKRNGKPWQNLVHIADGYTLLGAMHELGHVLGLVHEHDRSDRDTYIRFQYTKLADWDACWARARSAEGDRITPDGLCKSMYRALAYDCTCATFIKNFVEPGWPIKPRSGYDLNSIMHYPSQNGYAKQACNERGEDCALKVWVDWNNHGFGTTLLNQARRPSEMDLLWVKTTYPF